MKKIVYLHYSIIIFFVTCITNHGICQSPIIPKTQSITTQKIINEISPFIDDDTAIICYVNLLAFNEVHKFDKILDQLPDKETFNNNIRQYLESIIKSPPIQNSKINQNIFSNLIENDITHLYFILNMKDLKFGPYFIFPNVQENTSKSKAIENFFGIENNTNGKLASTTWAVYQKNRMIIVGLHPILDFMKLIYYCPFEQYATMILFPALENSICGFNNISSIDKKKYINSRFKNFKSNDNRSFQLGMREVDDCNMIKLIFLFPDTVVALELLHLRKMEEPLNRTTFEFLKNIRDYCSLGIDTRQPKVKLTIQCKSQEDAIKLKEFLDEVWRNICYNYCVSLLLTNPSYSDNENVMTAGDCADLLITFLPRQINNRLVLEIDKNFDFKKMMPKIKK